MLAHAGVPEAANSWDGSSAAGSFCSADSTASVRQRRWHSTLRMDVFNMNVMPKIFERVRSWISDQLLSLAVEMFEAKTSPGRMEAALAEMREMANVFWSDAETRQIAVVHTIYLKAVKTCQLGDWEVGYKQRVVKEDGLAALIEMCVARSRKLPALPWHMLMLVISEGNGNQINFTLLAHVLGKITHRYKQATKSGRQTFDTVLLLLAARISTSLSAGARASDKQIGLIQSVLFKFISASEDHSLSQLLLQCLLLQCCAPPDLRDGGTATTEFVSSLLRAVQPASSKTPGKLAFAEVQLVFILAGAILGPSPAMESLTGAYQVGLLPLLSKMLNCSDAWPLLQSENATWEALVGLSVSDILSDVHRELRAVLGAVKLVCVLLLCLMEASVRAACVLQLTPAALADVCLCLDNVMRAPEAAEEGGMEKSEVDLLAGLAEVIVPTTLESVTRLVSAQCIHLVASWPRFEKEVRRLTRQGAVVSSLQNGSVGDVWSRHTHAIVFLAGSVPEYEPLVADWERIRRVAEDVCEEATNVGLPTAAPPVAAPRAGRLFDLPALDVTMKVNLPATASLQHLARCKLNPAWIKARASVAPPRRSGARTSFHAASLAIEAQQVPGSPRPDRLLEKGMVNQQRMDTVAFSIGGAIFHALALPCEQNSPVMKAKLEKISNIYKQVIPMRNVGNLDGTSMYEAFTLVCEYMYTGAIEELEDAEVVINVWMVGSALMVRRLPAYVLERLGTNLASAPLSLLPAVFRQAHAAWQLSRSSADPTRSQGENVMQAVMELILCKLHALARKRFLNQVIVEHGTSFCNCLISAVGHMLSLNEEPTGESDSVRVFKYVRVAPDSASFWRQLAASVVIARHVRRWLERRRNPMRDPTAR